MTTAEAIEGMTDVGSFERLATQALRHLDEDSRLIEHSGVNAQGKTIPNPVDGFCRVPNSEPPRFVMHQFATTGRDKLEHKWLHRPTSVGSEAGDLAKAARLAEGLRGQFPGAQFVVWLCSNQRLDSDLMKRVYAEASQSSLEARLLGQSNLRDWLDQNPEGHWARQQFLDIAAERLSRSWFQDLAGRNLQNYAGEFPLVAPADFVETHAKTDLIERALTGAEQLFLLTGRSGSGKSVACYQLLQHCLAKGRISLWLSAEVVEKAQTLTEAVEITLRGLAPQMAAGAGEDGLQFSSVDEPLVVVVDDLNRVEQPARLLQKIMNWARPRHEESRGGRCRIICPIWDQHAASMRNQRAGMPWLAELSPPLLTLVEAETCLRAALGTAAGGLTSSQCRSLAERLGRDPILLSMYGRRYAATTGTAPGIEDIIGGYVADACADAAHDGQRLPAEYAAALEELARWMLGHRQYYPRWAQLADNSSGLAAVLPALRVLAQQGRLCRIANRSGEPHFEFRHDRLLGHHLAGALAGYLDDPVRHAEVLTDPYFVELVGTGFARKGFPAATLPWLKQNAPVALFAAMRDFNGRDRRREVALIAESKEWLREAVVNERAPWAQANMAMRFLEQADIDESLAITEDIADRAGVGLLRMQHGDVVVAIRWMIRRYHAFPGHRHPRLENCIDHARERHGAAMVRTLRACLLDPNLTGQHLLGAFSLAALIGDRSCAPEIKAAFDRNPGSLDALVWGFWAALRCAPEEPGQFLEPFIGAWRGLSTEKSDKTGGTPRGNFGDGFRQMDWTRIAPVVIDWLVEYGRANPEMRYEMVWLLHGTDHPSAVVFVTEWLGELIETKNGVNMSEMRFRDVWDPTNWHGRRMSAPSRMALRQLWQDSAARPALARAAMRTWVRGTTDLRELREVPRGHPQYESALWQRARFGDRTTIPEMIERLPQKLYWVTIIHQIWSPAFEPIIEEALTKLHEHTPADFSGGHSNGHYELSHLLRDIPKDVAEPILHRHWPQLRYSRLFIQVAIYIGTPRLLELAAAAIVECPKPSELFEHCGSTFGFRTSGLADRVDLPLLQRIVPYVRHLDSMTLGDLIHTALRLGEGEWVQQLRPECERRERENVEEKYRQGRDIRVDRFPTDGELVAEMEKLLANHTESRAFEIRFWFERLEDRVGNRDRAWAAFAHWFAQGRTAAKWTFVSEAVALFGTRAHLAAFRSWRPDETTPELANIEAGVAFEVMHRSPV